MSDKSNQEILKYTSYCGHYCKDCIPGNLYLYDTVRTLIKELDDKKLELYCNFKTKRYPEFEDYDKFRAYLDSILKMECTNGCREDRMLGYGCPHDCSVEKCVKDKGLLGCWECDVFEECEKILHRLNLHPNMLENLRAIKKHGIDNWLEHRGRHYFWNEELVETS